MQKNSSKVKKILAYAISVAAAGLFIVVLVRSVFYSPTDDLTIPLNVPVAHASTEKSLALYPVEIVIPALHVDAKVQEVGITKSGAMAVPTNFTSVGWYKYGVLPGQQGSAVFAGHVDDGLAFPGVFSDLDKLQPGDTITIIMSDKKALQFVMTASAVYDKDAPTHAVFSKNDGTYIQLITCAGTWMPLQKTHDKRLVVTAVLQE